MAQDKKRLQFIMDMVDKVTGPASKVNKSLQGMGKDVTATQKKLAGLNKTAGDIRGYKAMKAELDRNATTSKSLTDKVASLQAQIAATEKPTKAMKDALKLATREQQAHEKTSLKHKEALHKVELGLKSAGISTDSLERAERRTRDAIVGVNGELKRQQAALEAATRKQDQMTKAKERYNKAEEQAKKAMAAGGKMALGGAALMGGVIAAGAPNYNFQKQMSAVQAVGDFSKADRATLTNSARREASTSAFSATEAAQAQGYLAASGFTVKQIDQSLKGVLDLAAATETGLAETADISSNILSGFGLGADQMGRMGDILTATTSGHNVNLQMLGESMKYVAPIAKQTDQSAESIAAMVGLLGDVGIQGSMAGTALKGAMLRLAGPTKDAQKAFDSLNVSTKDAQGNVRAMPEVLEELQSKMKGMGSGDKLALLKRMFGEEPAAAIATLLDKAGDTIAEKTKRLEESAGAADRAAKTRLDNLWGDVQNFSSSVEEAQIEFGGHLDRMLRGVVRLATVGVDAFTKWQKENPKLAQALSLVAMALGAVMSVSGALIVALGSLWLVMAKARLAMFLLNWAGLKTVATWGLMLIKGVALAAWFVTSRTVMLAWAATCGTMRIAMAALNLVMNMNPIGLLITAVTALVAAGIWLYQNWENLPEIFSNLWAKIQGFLTIDPVALVREAWDGLGTYFSDLFGGIWDKFTATVGKIGQYLSGGMDWALGGFGMFDDNPELKEQVIDAPKTSDSTPAVMGKAMAQGGKVTPVAPVTRTTNQNTYQITIDAKGMSADELAVALDRRLAEERRKNEQQERARNKD